VTKARVDPGICGFPATIKVERIDKRTVGVHIACACEQIHRFRAEIPELAWREALWPILQNSVYQAASRTIRHATCPIPMAVVKAIEAEIGAALPRDVSVRFIEEGPGREETAREERDVEGAERPSTD